MATKRKADAMAKAVEEPVDPADELMFLCLGGGNEVGRSCHILQYKGKTVMLDAGMHAGYEGLAALPFYDDFDLSTVDVLLISHFHVDHAASLPYVLAKTNFRGRIFMTHPTKAIYKWLIMDSIRVGNAHGKPSSQVYTEADHLSTFPSIEAIDYYTTHTVSSIRITPYPAGHVLGAAMFLIEIAGLKIFFTGDYSREDDRHLISAEVPKNVKIDVLITESTYGIAAHIPRLEREQALMKSITNILNRGGRVLMPVFALGRAQELLLILDEYWGKHPEYQKIPIYYASHLAHKCMLIYQTYIGSMNENIKRLFREGMAESEASGNGNVKRGPWDFRYIRSLKNLDRFDDVGGCVMLASPGMFQSGVSRELLERWAPNEKNGVVITGYSVEGTMARQIMQEPEQIEAKMKNTVGARRLNHGNDDKLMIPRRCSVQELSFAAHVDGIENKDFIEEVGAPVVILVHGEQHNMMRLKSKLLSLNADKAKKVKVFSPRNCEELRIPFRSDKTAKVMGKLAMLDPPSPSEDPERNNSRVITGVLVQRDFKLSLVAPEDLHEYAGLTTTTLTCRQHLTLSAAGIDLIRWALEGTFGSIEQLRGPKDGDEDVPNGDKHVNGAAEAADEELPQRNELVYLVMGCVTLRYRKQGEIELEWEGNVLNDGIADAVMAVLLSVESSPAAIRQSASKHQHSHTLPKQHPHAVSSPTERLERLFMFLEAHFGADALTPVTTPRMPDRSEAETTKSEELATTDKQDAIKGETAATTTTTNGNTDGDTDTAMPDAHPSPPSAPTSNDDTAAAAAELELARLHRLGIPVPGIAIQVDALRAVVWLEDLRIECEQRVFAERVRAVVERAVEVVAPLWQGVGG